MNIVRVGGKVLNFSKRLVALAAVAALTTGALAGSASAHKRTITNVSAGVDEKGTISLHAFLDPEEHAGKMLMTLKKKNAAGKWVVVKKKNAPYGGLGWGYFTNFADVPGNKKCKGQARFTSNNHPTLTKTSSVFNC
jgi:hypothetical protein